MAATQSGNRQPAIQLSQIRHKSGQLPIIPNIKQHRFDIKKQTQGQSIPMHPPGTQLENLASSLQYLVFQAQGEVPPESLVIIVGNWLTHATFSTHRVSQPTIKATRSPTTGKCF